MAFHQNSIGSPCGSSTPVPFKALASCFSRSFANVHLMDQSPVSRPNKQRWPSVGRAVPVRKGFRFPSKGNLRADEGIAVWEHCAKLAALPGCQRPFELDTEHPVFQLLFVDSQRISGEECEIAEFKIKSSCAGMLPVGSIPAFRSG